MIINAKLFPKQIQAIRYLNDNHTREILYGGAKGGAKSFLGATFAIGRRLLYPNTYSFIAREELTDLRKYTIPTLYEVSKKMFGHELIDIARYNGQDNYFEFYNKSRIYLIACKYLPSDPYYTRFGSMQMTDGWIEEGGEIHELAYENLKLSIGRWNNHLYFLPFKLLITANPTKNWLYKDFYKPFKSKTLADDKVFVQSLATDNFAHSTDYINTLDNIQDAITKARLRYGDWEYSETENQLFEYDAILDMFTNNHVFDSNANMYISADIAMYGADKFVIFVWQGLSIIDYFIEDKSTPEGIELKIKEMAEKYSIARSRIAYDSDGIGVYLKSYLNNAVAIQNNHKAVFGNYENIKTEMVYKLSELINNRKILVKCKLPKVYEIQLIQELEAIRREKIDDDRKLRIESKAKVKERINRSPDLFDALLYRIIFVLFNK